MAERRGCMGLGESEDRITVKDVYTVFIRGSGLEYS